MRWIWIYGLCMSAGLLGAQPSTVLSNLKRLRIERIPPPWILRDSSIIPGSVVISDGLTGQKIPTSTYSIVKHTIFWMGDTAAIPFPLDITYRVYPPWLARQLTLQSPPTSPSSSADTIGYTYRPYVDIPATINFRKLDYSGRFSRGIGLGNRQDLSLNSGFNLQLAGDLGDGITLQAAISDENLPLQPEGTSLQLRDFDRVYVHLKRQQHELVAGDYDLQNSATHFMRYANRLQGARVKRQGNNGFQEAAFAVARGKFTRYVLPVQEGNQGPYLLQGATGERFIVLLAGTEQVWHNGQLLQRGADLDYTIDYNRGEILFTSKRRILRESRITIEYEYADQNFLRSVYAFKTSYTHVRGNLYTHFYSRQDSRTPTSNIQLTPQDRETLSQAGDDYAKALLSGLQSADNFAPSRAYYTLTDSTTSCGKIDSILMFTPIQTPVFFTARFTYVGPGKGNYRLDERPIANERTYYWVAPDPTSCQPQGDYEPVLQLNPPQQQQMLVVGQEWMIHPTTNLRSEVAFSRNDRNRFSSIDRQDNLGAAAFLEFSNKLTLQPDSTGWKLHTNLSLEALHQHFQPLNPYRAPEFLRDWSLANFNGLGTVDPAHEYLSKLHLTLVHPQHGQLTYQAQSFIRTTQYSGLKHWIDWSIKPKTWSIQGNMSILQANTTTETYHFLRPYLNIRKRFPKLRQWALYLHSEAEQNTQKRQSTQQLMPTSFAFYQLQAGIESPQEHPWGWNAAYHFRTDQLPENTAWKHASTAKELSISGYWNKRPGTRFQSQLSYRQLQTDSSLLRGSVPTRNTLLGRVDGTLQILRGFIRSQTTYELGSGQEPRQEYTFLKVAPGEGTYIWQDSLYNADGIVQAAEMQPAPFPDQADYIRVTTISTRFVQTDYLNLSQNLQLEPKQLWKTPAEQPLQRFLSKLSGQLSWRIQQKTQVSASGLKVTPYLSDISDTSLVGLNAGLRQSLTFNRGNPKWELQWVRQHTQNKQLQTTGYDLRTLQEQYGLLRWNPFTAWSLRTQAGTGQRKSLITWMQARNYHLYYKNVEAQLTWSIHTTFRTQCSYRFQVDEDVSSIQPLYAKTQELKLTGTFSPGANTALTWSIAQAQIAMTGDARSPAGFAILNGLQPGNNTLWSLSLDRQLNRTLQLRVQYDGRKTGQNRVVHNGRVQINAVF